MHRHFDIYILYVPSIIIIFLRILVVAEDFIYANWQEDISVFEKVYTILKHTIFKIILKNLPDVLEIVPRYIFVTLFPVSVVPTCIVRFVGT